MRIITLNANGIRSAASKGMFDWLKAQRSDVLCLQETKAQRSQLSDPVFAPRNYHAFFNDAEAKGYSGVAIYSRREPDQVLYKLGDADLDREGRYLELRFGRLSVVSLYLPSGSSSELRQQFKFRALDWFEPTLASWLASGRDYVLCGDWNIAHRPIDLKNWRGNQKNSGFLPEERAWLDRLLHPEGWVDAYRALRPDKVEYTWWSNRGQAWANNVGWRIDYQMVSTGLRPALKDCSIYRARRFSDHAPLLVDYDLPAFADSTTRATRATQLTK